MKVVCIKKGEWKGNYDCSCCKHEDPVYNEIYTVVDCRMLQGKPNYLLKEFSERMFCKKYESYKTNWYEAENFVSLDSYKEEELNQELNKIFENDNRTEHKENYC